MISKKTRNNIIIASISLVIVIIIAVLVYLYFTTDLFKSNSKLFAKYLGKTVQNVEALSEDQEGDQYKSLLQNNRYTSNTEVTAEYVNNIKTTDENTRNVINSLKLLINGKTDKLNGISYKDIALQKEGQNISEIEYLNSNERYGLRFSDLFNQYLVVKNEDLKKISAKLGLDTTNIPNTIGEFNIDETLKFTDEEISNMNDTYVNVIMGEYSKEKFSKQTKASITVNDQTVTTNAYTLTLTKEELNNIYIAVLEQLKQDETILSKIDSIDNFLNPVEEQETESEENETQENGDQENEAQGQEGETQEGENQQETTEEQTTEEQEETEENKTLKEKFIDAIDSKITEIKNTNIGDDEAKITVYESEGETVKTTIKTQEYETSLETTKQQGTYIKYFKEIYGIDENSDEIIIEKRNGAININRERKLGQNVQKTRFSQERTIADGKQEKTTTFSYDMGKNKIEIQVKDNKEVVNEFDKIPEFTNSNTVVLNSLNDEQFENIKNTLNDNLIEKLQAVSEQVNYEELFRILTELEILPEQITIEDLVTLTRSEVSKFNATFEIYKGQKVNVSAIDNLLKIVKDNLDTVEVLSDNAIKLNIVKGTSNEELANKVSEIINSEENKNKEYSIEYEYDEETNIIKAVIIQILEKQ